MKHREKVLFCLVDRFNELLNKKQILSKTLKLTYTRGGAKEGDL